MKERPPSIKWIIPPRFDESGVQISSGIAVDGREYPDGVPMAPPIGYEAPTQLEQLIEQVVRRRDFEKEIAAQGAETFDEADDFEVDEDYDPRFEETIYEAYFEAKSKRAAERSAAQAAASGQTSFSGLDAAPLKAKTAEKPIGAGSDTRSSLEAGSDKVGPETRQSSDGHSDHKSK